MLNAQDINLGLFVITSYSDALQEELPAYSQVTSQALVQHFFFTVTGRLDWTFKQINASMFAGNLPAINRLQRATSIQASS